jgi:predicted cation transporter
MRPHAAIIIPVLLLLGPLTFGFIEENLEIYIFALGIAATLCGSGLGRDLILKTAREPIPIAAAVVVAGIVFSLCRERLDRIFTRLRPRFSRMALTAAAVFLLAVVSSLITAIIAAVVLIELVGLLQLGGARKNARIRLRLFRDWSRRGSNACRRATLRTCGELAEAPVL